MVVIWLVSGLAVAAFVIVIGVADNKMSVVRLLGYVIHGYDVIVVVIIFVVIDIICVGMYNQLRFLSWDVKWHKVGI
jgi:hypothetical protein